MATGTTDLSFGPTHTKYLQRLLRELGCTPVPSGQPKALDPKKVRSVYSALEQQGLCLGIIENAIEKVSAQSLEAAMDYIYIYMDPTFAFNQDAKAKLKPKVKKETSLYEAAVQSIDKTKDASWTGLPPLEQLRNWCKDNGYSKPLFEKISARLEDGTKLRFKCVLVKEKTKQKEEFAYDECFETIDQCKDIVATFVLWKKIQGARPHYRNLSPVFRDLWLGWMKAEEETSTRQLNEADARKEAFIVRICGRSIADDTEDDSRSRKKTEDDSLFTDDLSTSCESAESFGHAAISTISKSKVVDRTCEELGEVVDSWEDLDEITDSWEQLLTDEKAPDEEIEKIMYPLEDELGSTNPMIKANAELLRDHLDMLKKMAPPFKRQQEQIPIYKVKKAILAALEEQQVLLISGETGCGKTTQVPKYILEEMIKQRKGASCSIIVTQPRRISAISVAQRVAEEMGTTVDTSHGLVGYQIRLQRRSGPCTRLLFCTTGILLRKIQSDPTLSGISHIILDEVHERAVSSDFLLILVRHLIGVRKDLKVILMSATLNADTFREYFGGCVSFAVPGRLFPVQDFFIEDIVQMLKYEAPPICKSNQIDKDYLTLQGPYTERTVSQLIQMDFEKIDFGLIELLIRHIDAETNSDGGILVFLPGFSEIQTLYEIMNQYPRMQIHVLHSLLSANEQCEVFQFPPPRVRKVVLATNIAETSITIPDISYVIDSGRMREQRFQAASRTSALVECWVSRANALQRRGRAGRVKSGKCFHLFTKKIYDTMLEFQVPEMLRVPLEGICLQIRDLGLGKCREFLAQAIEPPPHIAVEEAVKRLIIIGAMDDQERLSPLGNHLAKLPVDVQLGKTLVYSVLFKCVDSVAAIAAFNSSKSPFLVSVGVRRGEPEAALRRFSTGGSDHLTLLKVYRQWESARNSHGAREFCKKHFICNKTMQTVHQTKQQLIELLMDTELLREGYDCDENKGNEQVIKAVLCAGLFPNVARVVPQHKGRKIYAGSEEVSIHASSIFSCSPPTDGEWLMFTEKVKTQQLALRDITSVSPFILLMFSSTQVEVNQKDCFFTIGGNRIGCTPQALVLSRHLKAQLDRCLNECMAEPALIESEGANKVLGAFHFLLT